LKAALFYGGKDIRIETVSKPDPEPRQVQVRVHAAGICGSDLHGYHATPVKPSPPRRGGHELVGVVSATSEDVTQFQVGDRVVVEPTIPCGDCPECLNGNYNICSKLRHLGGSNSGGGFGEYMVAPAGNTYLLPDNVTFEAGALTEVYAVAVHALARAPVQPGDLVAVIGSGPVGLTIAQMADLAGARSIIVLGKPDQPLRISQNLMGCTVVNVDTSDPVEAVKCWSGDRGANVVFEAVGGQSNTLQQATEIAAKRGRICIVGGHTSPITFSDHSARSRELTVSWAFCYGRRDGHKEFQVAIDLLSTGKLNPMPLITHRFPLSEICQAFEVAAKRQEHGSIKVLVLP